MPNRSRIAEALAGSPAAYDSQGLQPPAIDPIMLLSSAAGPAIAKALAGMGQMAPRMMAQEAGAIFPEGTAPDILPVVARGSKTGDPHALFAYEDMFGPGMTKRKLYNIFGDPSHESVKGAGWGSSVTEDVLKKYGIPVVGKEPPRTF